MCFPGYARLFAEKLCFSASVRILLCGCAAVSFAPWRRHSRKILIRVNGKAQLFRK
jgi:hypothetical protein